MVLTILSGFLVNARVMIKQVKVKIKAPQRGLSFLRIGACVTALVFLFDLFFFCFDSGFLFVTTQTCIRQRLRCRRLKRVQ